MKVMLAFLFSFIVYFAAAQELSIPVKLLANSKPGAERYLGTDAFGWKYTIADNEFRKQKDSRIVRYKAVALGTIYKADLQNPLQIVLFYKKFNTAVLLDNQLNETARINFSELQQPVLAEAVGLASQNRLWVYDANTQQVGLYDTAPRSFKALTPPFNKMLQYYQSGYNFFYWADEGNSLYAVNLFGKVSYLGKLPAFEQLHLISPTQVLLQNDNTLYLYNPQQQNLGRVAIAEKSFKSFDYTAQILSIFTDREIIYYNITLPE